MSPPSRAALILVSIKVIAGQELFKRLITEIKKTSWDLEFSSVYCQYETEQRYDFDANMVTVLKVKFNKPTREYADTLKAIQRHLISYAGPQRVEIIPLVMDGETAMTPELTLPHPRLHGDSLVTRCAAEVWGSYEHPILKKTLNDLARLVPPITNAEFMLQGKSLVGP